MIFIPPKGLPSLLTDQTSTLRRERSALILTTGASLISFQQRAYPRLYYTALVEDQNIPDPTPGRLA